MATVSPAGEISVAHVFHPRPQFLVEPLEALLGGRRVVALENMDAFLEALPSIEALVAFRPPRGHWGAAAQLRLLQMVGAGVDSVLPADDLPASCTLANARGLAAAPMSEFALAVMLALAKGLPRARDQQREHRWRRWAPSSLRGSTVAILGLGAIGSALAARLRGFDARVLGVQKHPQPVAGVDRVVGPEGLDEVLAAADWVVVLLPKTPATEGLLDGDRLDQCKPGARLVHLARGGIVDEQALLARLRSGRLAGAAVDVFEQEPLPEDSPLWEAPNLLLTPHVAGGFPEYYQELARLFVENIGRIERGECVRNPVDRGRGY